MTTLPFVKCHGAGNDFILIDQCNAPVEIDWVRIASKLCDRRQGIGADGLLLLLPSKIADYRMWIFNADGSQPAMCGNGIRCVAHYLFKRNPTLSEVSIETPSSVLRCKKLQDEVVVSMGSPAILHWPIEVEGEQIYVVNMGVPHAVVFVDDLETIDVEKQGRQLRSHPHFAPQGTNVNFVCLDAKGKLAMRTYERGVEAETLSCGTGATAAAFVAMRLHCLPALLSVLTRASLAATGATYQQKMRFHLDMKSGEMEMMGPAEEVFEGTVIV